MHSSTFYKDNFKNRSQIDVNHREYSNGIYSLSIDMKI